MTDFSYTIVLRSLWRRGFPFAAATLAERWPFYTQDERNIILAHHR